KFNKYGKKKDTNMKKEQRILALVSILGLTGCLAWAYYLNRNSQQEQLADSLPEGSLVVPMIGLATSTPEVSVVAVTPPTQDESVSSIGEPCWTSVAEFNRTNGPIKHGAITGNGWKCVAGGGL